MTTRDNSLPCVYDILHGVATRDNTLQFVAVYVYDILNKVAIRDEALQYVLVAGELRSTESANSVPITMLSPPMSTVQRVTMN